MARFARSDGERRGSKSIRRARKHAIVVGTGEIAARLATAYACTDNTDWAIIGVVSESRKVPDFDDISGLPVIGTVADLDGIIEVLKPDWIIIATADEDGEIPERLLLILLRSGVHLRSASDVYEELTGKLPIDLLSPRCFLYGPGLRPRSSIVLLNRLFSMLVAASAVIISGPAMIVISAAIKLDSPGPVLFVQDRAGFGGCRFPLFKFRTMRVDSEQRSVWVADNSDRITRIGKWLRRFRLDELPQLFNVLRGDMNLVGPRPHPSPSCELVELISRNICTSGAIVPYYSMRSLVRPGITGWAQVRYKYANGIGEELEKLRYDLYYVKHYSFRLDIRILLMTVGVVLKGDGFIHEEQSTGQSGPAVTIPVRRVRGFEVEDGAAGSVPVPVPGGALVGDVEMGKQPGKRA